MKHPIRNDRREHRGANPTGAIDIVERRSAPRQPFIAEVQVIEISSGAKLSARSCDLVANGCYVDSLNTFPVGTLVQVRLKKEKTIIEVKGSVVYRMPGLGMGIAFNNLTPETHEALEKWLSHKPAERDSFAAALPPVKGDQPPEEQGTAGQFAELVQMLMKKGILNSAEAGSLLRKPLDE
jgi:hypothetical protein